MWKGVKSIFIVRCQPGPDTALALLTALLMIPVYYIGAHQPSRIVGLVVFVILGNGILNVLLPAYYMLVVRKESSRALGITTDRLWLALGLSLLWAAMCWAGLRRELRLHPEADLLSQLVFNGMILWEPFFVYGWLQLRFERAFGMVPGVILAAVCFGAYHLGTYPLAAVGMLVVIGTIDAILFRLTKNLLTLWPLVWTVSSSIGTLQGGFSFGWDQVVTYALLLLVQMAAIGWMILQTRQERVAAASSQ